MSYDKKQHRKVEGSMKKVILCVLALAAMLSLVEAAPFQTLGMLRTPDAYVLPHLAAELLLVGYYRDVAAPGMPAWVAADDDLRESWEDSHKGFFPYGMVGVGILNRVELGIFAGDYTEEDGMVYFMNAKVKVLEETLRIPQLSVGIDNVLSPQSSHRSQDLDEGDDFVTHPDRDAYEYYSPYVVGSKQFMLFGVPWMYNLGVGSNRFVGQVGRSRVLNGIFTSMEISPINDVSIQAEFDGEDFNAGVKYTYKNFGFKIGATAIEDWAKGSEDNGYEENMRVAFGISYLFDKYAEAKRRPDLSKYATTGEMESTEIVEVGETPVATEPSTDVTTTLQTPGLVSQGGASYKEVSPEVRDLLKELQTLREERGKAQQALDDLRLWIQELKKPKN